VSEVPQVLKKTQSSEAALQLRLLNFKSLVNVDPQKLNMLFTPKSPSSWSP
jgi:hypothetical protein